MNEKQPQRPDSSTELKQVEQDVNDTMDLALRTGISYDTQAQAEQHGIRQKSVHYMEYDDEIGKHRPDVRDAVATDTAAISHRYDIDDSRQAIIHEETGIYSSPPFRDGEVENGVSIMRPDGKGGIYRGHIGGAMSGDSAEARAKRATAIIAKRADRQISEAVIDRAITMGEELKEKRDKNK